MKDKCIFDVNRTCQAGRHIAVSNDSSYQTMIDQWEQARFTWDQKTLIGVGDAMLDKIRELDAYLSVEQLLANRWEEFVELMGDDSYTELEPEGYVKLLDDAEEKLHMIRKITHRHFTTNINELKDMGGHYHLVKELQGVLGDE